MDKQKEPEVSAPPCATWIQDTSFNNPPRGLGSVCTSVCPIGTLGGKANKAMAICGLLSF